MSCPFFLSPLVLFARLDASRFVLAGFRPTIVNTSVEPVPVAHLHLWYSLIREKRPLRRDFLKILVRSFDVDAADSSSRTSVSRVRYSSPLLLPNFSTDSTSSAPQDAVDFCRFLADNLATFDYKTQEEVLVVLDRLTAIVAVSGSHLFDILSSFEVPEDQSDQPIAGEVFEIRVGASMRTSMAEDEGSEEDEEMVSPSLLRLCFPISRADHYLRFFSDLRRMEIPSPSIQTPRANETCPKLVRPLLFLPRCEQPILTRLSSRFAEVFKAESLANVSIILSLVLSLKAHLKLLYNLPEAFVLPLLFFPRSTRN